MLNEIHFAPILENYLNLGNLYLNMKWKNKNLTPSGISWLVTIILLLIATWYNVITEGSLGILGIIFSISLVVYFISYLVLREK